MSISLYTVLYNVCLCQDSAIGIATRQGLDGLGIESRWGLHFLRPSRPAPGPTQPAKQRVSDHTQR
jgi:hypothetical protein